MSEKAVLMESEEETFIRGFYQQNFNTHSQAKTNVRTTLAVYIGLEGW
jgi:hypothetical protein